MTATTTVRFDVAPEVAFDYLSDPGTRPEWQSSLRSVELLSDGPPGVGSRWVDHTAVGVRPHMETTVHDRPVRWTEVGQWHGLEAELSLSFQPRGAVTDVRADFTFRGGPAWRPLAFVLSKVSAPAVGADLRRAARLLAERRSG